MLLTRRGGASCAWTLIARHKPRAHPATPGGPEELHASLTRRRAWRARTCAFPSRRALDPGPSTPGPRYPPRPEARDTPGRRDAGMSRAREGARRPEALRQVALATIPKAKAETEAQLRPIGFLPYVDRAWMVTRKQQANDWSLAVLDGGCNTAGKRFDVICAVRPSPTRKHGWRPSCTAANTINRRDTPSHSIARCAAARPSWLQTSGGLAKARCADRSAREDLSGSMGSQPCGHHRLIQPGGDPPPAATRPRHLLPRRVGWGRRRRRPQLATCACGMLRPNSRPLNDTRTQERVLLGKQSHLFPRL